MKEKENRTRMSEYLVKRKYHGRPLGLLKLKLKQMKAWRSQWYYADKRGVFVPNDLGGHNCNISCKEIGKAL